MKLENVILPAKRDNRLWDIEVKDGYIHTISPSARKENVNCSLLLPALCHPHIHIDKSYILTCNIQPTSADQPDYTDLAPRSGSFSEALVNTSQAKARYTFDDLYLRGSQLLATSYRQGVTSLRAFVELDHVTKTLPLRVAINLKQDFAHLVEVQICAFAQDALFSTEHGEANRSIITSALQEYSSDIEVLGTTPYVENSLDSSTENIEWAITTALKYNIHLDFHLDYNLDPPSSKTPLVYTVIELLQKQEWLRRAGKKRTIVLGHCTQLTVLQNSDLASLATEIRSSGLPIHFVGLPTSDIFMMGRPMPGIQSAATSQVRPRATLQVLSMIKDFGFSACFGVNNLES
ncbi:hypothetical protein BX600DRAFT_160504 [Xylariales sp. PMI_506]|nr:hypothetical protein BX600DRAFT_160504 [Xylariales sp. PMI_506]